MFKILFKGLPGEERPGELSMGSWDKIVKYYWNGAMNLLLRE